MTTTVIRKKLIDYLSDADEKKVKAVYALFEEEIEADMFSFSKEQLALIEERRDAHKSGNEVSIDWKKAHKSIRAKGKQK